MDRLLRHPQVGLPLVATFRDGVDMAEVLGVVAEEQARVAELQANGTLGALYLATASRGTVFLEIFAETSADALAAVSSLPMAKWWNLDAFALNPPVVPGAGR